jgi:3-oxoacyl-[acyl-carrier protein] reductase
MSRGLEGKVAIVTGAATGIGKAIAFAFGEAGARVVVNHLDTPDLAEAVVAQIAGDGGEALPVAADVSSRAEFEAMVSATFHHFGSWDALVNNAGIALVKPFGEVTEDEFDRSFQVNVKGTFNGCQLALERMADGGRVINISSSTTGLMLPGYGVYDATKGAIEAMTHVIAKSLGGAGSRSTRSPQALPKPRPIASARARVSLMGSRRCLHLAASEGPRISRPWLRSSRAMVGARSQRRTFA